MRILIILSLLVLNNITAQETQTVHCTVYNAVPAQTNSDPGHTATMFELDLNDPYKHRIVALSRDLLKKFPYGSLVQIEGTKYDGCYTVEDTMNKRYTNRIDLLINEDMQIGSWPNVTITKIK